MTKPIRTIFAGTPDFAVPYLEGLINDPLFEVVGVLTQPDRPSGRKQILTPSAIKISALQKDLLIWQSEKLKADVSLADKLQAVKADLLVVVAYGQIIPQIILDLFPIGSINVHPSLLPKYRGASPIQSALLNGEKETGITIMLMDDKMDHGPILAQERISLTGEETNESLHHELAGLGVPLLMGTIKKFSSGKIKPQTQVDSLATYCQTITKETSRISWQDSAEIIRRKIYAFYPWPATYGQLGGKRIKFFPPVEIIKDKKNPGEIFESAGRLAISASDGSLIIDGWQMEGKKRLSNGEFLRGMNDIIGQNFIS